MILVKVFGGNSKSYIEESFLDDAMRIRYGVNEGVYGLGRLRI